MAIKVITSKEAQWLAYEVAQLSKTRAKNFGIDVYFHSKYEGKWRWTHYIVTGPSNSFHIKTSRWKHNDGRIRGASNTVENPLNFALWCIKNLKNTDHHLIKEFKHRLKVKSSIIYSLTGSGKQYARDTIDEDRRYRLSEISEIIDEANVYSLLAA